MTPEGTLPLQHHYASFQEPRASIAASGALAMLADTPEVSPEGFAGHGQMETHMAYESYESIVIFHSSRINRT